MLGFRHDRELIKTLHHLEHFFGNPAAAVAVAEHRHGLPAGVFILIGFPVFLNLARHIPSDKVRRRHAGINFAAVNAFPDKVVVRETVGVVPGRHFVGNKIINAAFFKNLRQNPAVAEYIRQPAVVNGLTEFFAEILLPVKALANQTFCRRNVAVRLDIHRAHGFKLPVCDFFAKFFEHFGVIFFQRFVGVRLRVGIVEFGITVH